MIPGGRSWRERLPESSGINRRGKSLPIAFVDDAGSCRNFRTGDLVRYREDGSLGDFWIEIDQQVKIQGIPDRIRGDRKRLAQHSGVREAVVVVPALSGGRGKSNSRHTWCRLEDRRTALANHEIISTELLGLTWFPRHFRFWRAFR